MVPAVVLALTLSLSQPAALHPVALPLPPVDPVAQQAPPELDAAAWALYSVDLSAEFLSVNADERRAMASVTKVMTALLVVENTEPDEPVTISANAASTPLGYVDQPRVQEGDRWTVDELLANLLVQSGNDAAVALAEHVAGSEEAFVEMMNQRADELGLGGTRFANPNGLDADEHYSTADDLITLGLAAISEPRILGVTSLRAVTFAPGIRDPIQVTNTNRLLGTFPGVLGIKTGDTLAAGKVLLSYLDTGAHQFLGVVMGAPDHYRSTEDLLAYALTTLGPRDYLLAPVAGTPLDAAVPQWLLSRMATVGELDEGSWSTSRRGSSLGEQRVIAAFRDLLPPILGGSE